MAGLIVALLLALTPTVAHADPVSITVFLASNVGAWAASAFVFVWNYATYIIAFGSMYASSQSQKRKAERAARDALRDRTVMVRSSEAPQNVVYGRARVSGPIAYAVTSGQDKEFLHLVVVLAGHEIDAIEEVWLNDEPLGTLDANGWVQDGTYAKARTQTETQTFTVPSNRVLALAKTPASIQSVAIVSDGGFSYFATPYTSSGATVTLTDTSTVGQQCLVTYTWDDAPNSFVRVKKFLGVAAGARDTDLETASDGAWTADHLGKGVARVHLTLKYDQDVFPSGIPNVSAVVRGKKVLDPRTGVTAWSNNPALCVRDYLTSVAGFGAGSVEIDATAVAAAANICDELVNYDATNTHARYSCDGAFTLDASRREILEDLLGSMVGTAVFSGGKWVIRAGAYVTPTLDLDDGDLADGSVQVQARTGRRELFNAVRGQFVDPTQKYAVVDFPPYASSTFASEDGGETVYQDVQLPFTADTYRAQRIAKLVLFRARQALIMAATWKLPAYALQPSDTVRLTVARYGWTNKVFRVVEREYVHPHQVKLTLQEESSAVYAWNFSEAVTPDPAPNTDLPDPRIVPSISGLIVTSGETVFRRLADGTVRPLARLSWSALADAGVTQGGSIEVRWKRASETVWASELIPGAETKFEIETAPNEILNISVRAINGVQVRGAWTFTTHTVSSLAGVNGTPSTTGGGGNLVRNAGLRYDRFPWERWDGSANEAASWTFSQVGADDLYAPRPYGALLFESPALASTFTGFAAGCPATYMAVTESGDRVGVFAGARYEVQVRARTVNGRSQLVVVWYDISGSVISSSAPTGGRTVSTNYGSRGQASLSNYDLLWGFVTAPAGATRALIVVNHERVVGTFPTFIYTAMPLLREVSSAAQTAASPFVEGEGSVNARLIEDDSASIVQEAREEAGVTSNVGNPNYVTLISGSITNDDAQARDCLVTATAVYEATRLSGYTFLTEFFLHDGTTYYKLGEAREATETATISGTVSIQRAFSVAPAATLSYSMRIRQENYSGSVTYRNLTLRAELIKK